MWILRFRDPDSLRSRCAKTNLVLIHRQGNGAVVVSGFDPNVNARTESLFLEEFQELPVTLVNAGHHIFDTCLCLAEQAHPPFATFCRTTQRQPVSVRASVFVDRKSV